MKYVIIISHGGKIMIPPVIDGINVEWQRKGQPGKMTFSVVKTEGLSFNEGDAVRLSVNNKPFFYGFVFEKSRQGLENKKLDVVCYDQLFYLTKNKDTYVFEDKTAADIIRMLAEDFHLNLGSITATPLKIDSLVEDNKSLYDMIAEALSLTTQSTGVLYTLYDKAGKLTLSSLPEMTVNYLINEDSVGNFDYKTSIAEDTYNRVKLTHEDNNAGTRQVYFAIDPAKENKWGVLQYYEKLNNSTMAQTKAMSILRMYDSKSRTLTLKNVLGDTKVRAGSLLPCKLGLGDLNLSNYMMVDQVKHSFRENEHTMELKFAEYRPLADVSNVITQTFSTQIPQAEVTPREGSGNMRTTKPAADNKYYITVGGGGYNKCIAGNAANGRQSSTSVLPNCVGYCYGRWMEDRGITSCNLPTCDAQDWYSVAQSRGFNCSQTPSVGSVAVFRGGGHGHVAYVEDIDANGNLIVSESQWSGAAFKTTTVYKSNGYNYSSSRLLVGFIS